VREYVGRVVLDAFAFAFSVSVGDSVTFAFSVSVGDSVAVAYL
jgi:hypothetical protein